MTPPDPRTPLRLVLVSDLHMGAGDEYDRFRRDREFAAFCRSLAASDPGGRGTHRLVVLGDFLELLAVRAGDEGGLSTPTEIALARLERIVEAHSDVFSAMADFVRAGWGVDVVAGNHDIDLVRPAIQHRVRALLGGRDGRRSLVRFHPWILHVPGVLYAEHGHQYHDVNWFPELVCAAGPHGEDAIDHPPAAFLGERGLARATGLGRVLSRQVLGTRDPRRRTYRQAVLDRLGRDVGLDPAVLRQIDRLPAVSARQLATRLAIQAVRREPAGGPSLRDAAARIDGVLRRASAGCAFYAFGHSHVAEYAPPVEEAGVPGYLNPGTWSVDVRGPLRHAPAHQRCTYAVVERAAGAAVHGSVASWTTQAEKRGLRV